MCIYFTTARSYTSKIVRISWNDVDYKRMGTSFGSRCLSFEFLGNSKKSLNP